MCSPKVFAIIINWNGDKDTIQCLNSLLSVRYDNLNVVISDNGSRQESLDAIRHWLSKNPPGMGGNGPVAYALLENGRNLGFTGANTVGIKLAVERGADYVLFLNNDTTVSPDFLSRMIAVSEGNAKYGILGCKILSASTQGQEAERIWSLGGYKWHCGIPLNIASGKLDRPKWKGVIENDLINGCCMLIRRPVIDQIGVQDDALFFGMDDVEYSFRAMKHGWQNAIVLDAQIHHIGSHSVGGSPVQAYYLFRNMLFLRATNFRWHENLQFALIYAIRYVLLGGVARLLLGRTVGNTGMIYGIRDFFTGKMGECHHPSLMKR